MVWNMYDFFTMYAEVDNWEWGGSFADPSEQLQNPLDQWIVSRVHQLTAEVEKHMDAYDLPNAMKPILPFIDDASNWYVRRSRRRFWKSEDDGDKQAAYRTLHYVLVQLAHVLAPFTPFLAEELFQKLTGQESVHLRDWPATGHVNELIMSDMAKVREFINQGLSQRAGAGIKVRQPLAEVKIYGAPNLMPELLEIIQEELNVKQVASVPRYDVKAGDSFEEVLKKGEDGYNLLDLKVEMKLSLTPELKREGMVREVIRNVQSARKQAGLNVDDRIVLSVSSTDEQLRQAIKEHSNLIQTETLANKLVFDQQQTFETSCTVDDAPLTISLQKA